MTRPAATLAAECPLCSGASGDARIAVRALRETRTYGIPFVARVPVTRFETLLVEGVCSACDWRLFRKRVLAWTLELLSFSALFALAARFESLVLAGVAVLVTIFSLLHVLYGLADRLVWGADLLRRLQLPPDDYEIPASPAHGLLRGLGMPYVLVMLAAIVMALSEG